MYRVRARDAARNRSKNSRKLIATASNKVVIAAAGDIACDPSDPNFHNGTGTSTACRQLSTSNVLVSGDFEAVLALGDLQYNSGSLDDFRQAYDPTWGRVKSITYPGGRQPRIRPIERIRVLPVLRKPRRNGRHRLVQLRSRELAHRRDQLGVRPDRRMRHRLTRGEMVAERPRGASGEVHHRHVHKGRYSSGHDGDNTFMQPMWADLY